MNYEQLWKDLKAEYEKTIEDGETRLKSMKGKENTLSNLAKVSCRSIIDNNAFLKTVLARMRIMESNQTLDERETIEHAIDELRRDRKCERYHIKALRFEKGSEENRWEHYCHDVEIYDDYHLFTNGYYWFIVFYKGDREIWHQEFERVKIIYWDDKKEGDPS